MGNSKNNRATVGVIVVNYNGGDMLDRCIASMKKQTFIDYILLVIDNGSSDNSISTVRSCYPDVQIIEAGQNLGFAAANNLAIQYLADKVDFIALLNPDAFPEPDWLEQLVSAADANPAITAFCSKQLCHENNEIIDGAGDIYHISGLVRRRGYMKQHQPGYLQPREVFSCCAAAALYRIQPLLDISGFDEDFFCYVEDVDLGFRLRLSGHKFMYIPDAVVSHVGSGTSGKRHSDFCVYYGHRNIVWLYVKNMPGILFWLLLPLQIIQNAFTIIYFTVLGKWRVIIKAKIDALKGLRRALEKRNGIQRNRVVSISEIWRVLDKRLSVWKLR